MRVCSRTLGDGRVLWGVLNRDSKVLGEILRKARQQQAVFLAAGRFKIFPVTVDRVGKSGHRYVKILNT